MLVVYCSIPRIGTWSLMLNATYSGDRLMKTVRITMVVMLMLFATSRSAAELALLDDFNDGNDDGWFRVDDLNVGKPWGPGIYDASSGAYHLETTGPLPLADPVLFPPGDPIIYDPLDSGLVAAVWLPSTVDRQYDNGIFRAKFRTGNVGTTADMFVRTAGAGDYYSFSAPGPFGFFNFIRGEGAAITRLEVLPGVVFSPGEDWWSEVRFVGDTFEWTVWKDGELRPATPQLVVQDSTYSSGFMGVSASVFTNNIAVPTPTDATFDDIFFMHIPEPATALLAIVAAAFHAGLRRPRRNAMVQR
jgi:hypothetical protein